MYLAQHTDYGLRVLIYTTINDNTLADTGTIAETYDISKSHLMKMVISLVKGGFLVSMHDKGGGLRSADAPERINTGAVVHHLEPMQVVECMGDNNECLATLSCRLTGIVTGAVKVFFNHLGRYLPQDLLDKLTYDIPYAPCTPINEIHETAD